MLTMTLRDKEAFPAFHSIQPSGYGEDRRWLEKDLEELVKAVSVDKHPELAVSQRAGSPEQVSFQQDEGEHSECTKVVRELEALYLWRCSAVAQGK